MCSSISLISLRRVLLFFGISGTVANSGTFYLVPNYIHIEDWGSHENHVWIYVHSNKKDPFGVLLAIAAQQDCGFQLYQNVTVE